MVHVIINSHVNSNDQKELLFLDFQGSFDVGEHVDLSNIKVGDLTLKEVKHNSPSCMKLVLTIKKDSAMLVIGHHRLVGKKVKLPKPLAVMKKQPVEQEEMSDGQLYYNVVTILREKYVFSNRPGLMVHQSLRGLSRVGG
jgi:chromosome transmission fidelity protein 8